MNDTYRSKNRINNKVWIFNDENKYLMKTSKMISLTGLWGIMNKEFKLSPVLCVMSLVSNKYWQQPKNNIIRFIDVSCVRLFSAYFAYNAYYDIKNPFVLGVLPCIYSLGGLYYILGCNNHRKRNRMWYMDHVIFHTLSMIGHFVNINYYIINKT